MIINWFAAKAQQFLPGQEAGLDELSTSFDFALSSEIMNLLYAQNDECHNAGVIAEDERQARDANATDMTPFALDEHELALA